MSKETIEWLNQNVLIGNTEKRGNAWHWRASAQGEESNHYPKFIPVEDVARRLFAFEAIEPQAAYLVPATFDPELLGTQTLVNGEWFNVVVDKEHKAIVDSETGVVFNYPTNDWQQHSYKKWLLDNVASILDDDLGITSAGLLRRRGLAWVEVSIPDNIETLEGVTFRPNLLVGTSYDSTVATFLKRTIGETVCDNTLHANRNGAGEEFRVKHTLNSGLRIGDARKALNIIFSAADDFTKQIHDLCATDVTEQQWQDVLGALFPYPEKESEHKPGRSWSGIDNKRAKIDELYHYDERCAPWTGNAYGVVQTLNTWKIHHATVRNTSGGGRAERYQLNVINGNLDAWDTLVLDTVDKVLVSAN
jgi:phage/plasmid-like protein (TIGR03299 family)